MRWLTVIGAAAVLGLAGCGGDDKAETAANNAAGPAATPQPPEGAGRAYTSTPSTADLATPATQSGGRVIARSGFDIEKDSFAFANYGKNRGPMLRAQEVAEMFGNSVCASGSGKSCVLTPTAERWRVAQNANWSGGHCYGFSTLSLAIFAGRASASEYGAQTTHQLRIADRSGQVTNPELAADLTRSAAMQTLASVQRKVNTRTPRQAVEFLKQAFNSPDPNYVLAFFMPGEGGHAVVPIGLVDQGGGIYEILLYDNNFPYFAGNPGFSDRRMKLDTNRDRWEYRISIRPDVPTDLWFGEGKTNPLQFIKAADNSLPQPCPFCPRAQATTPTTVSLAGAAEKRGHLRITDAEGRVTGYKDGELVNEIPGAEVQQAAVIAREFVEPEPLYHMPSGVEYTVEVVDVPQDAPPAQVNVTGPGVGVGLTEITEPGTALVLSPDGAVTLQQPEGSDQTLELSVAVEGGRQVELSPESNTVRLVPGSGDNLEVEGQVSNGTVSNPSTGKTAPIPGAGGTFDLSDSVGTAG